MPRFLLILVVCLGWMTGLHGQEYSDDPTAFYGEAIRFLNSLENEASFKVVYDLKAGWDGDWTREQRQQIARIGHKMSNKRFSNMPDFWNYLAYLAYARAQEDLTSAELNGVLEVNEKALSILPRQQYRAFLYGLNLFFARRYLAYEDKLTVQANGGSYAFLVAGDDQVDLSTEEDALPPVDTVVVQSDPWANESDPFADLPDDPFADPFAGQEDPFADPFAGQEDPFAVGQESFAQSSIDLPPTEPQFILEKKQNYVVPERDGPLIDLKGITLSMRTPRDSARFEKSEGYFLLGPQLYVGTKASFVWPGEYDKMDGARVELGKFVLNPKLPRFITPFAEMTFDKFSNLPIEGQFEFRPTRALSGKLSNYPVFSSLNDDVVLDISDSIRYVGGLEVRGQEFYGQALTGKKGTLYLKASDGREVHVHASRFYLGDSSITTSTGAVSIVHGTDSVYHPAMNVSYDVANQKLVAYRTKKHNVTPIRSTYFGVDLAADLIRWDMKSNRMTFNVLNGKMEIPLIIESTDYFTPDRYDRLKGHYPFHPIDLAVGFSRDRNLNPFTLEELLTDPLVKQQGWSREILRGAMELLNLYGFVSMDRAKGVVKLKSKAFLYYDAVRKRVDFDYLYMEGFSPDSTNALWLLDSGQLVVKGVRSFSVSKDYKIEIEPDHGNITLLQNRGFRMDGEIMAGDFIYDGKEFEFDYDAFSVTMPVIDSIRLDVPLPDSLQRPGEEKVELSNNLSSTAGVLYLERPDNKSSRVDNKKYPLFTTDSEAVVYFDGPEILNGAYDRSVKFILPPFEVDSIDREAGTSFEFQGTFSSGDIFPEFEETLSIQPDRSLGFIHQVPGDGYNLYGTEARTYDRIRLSNDGLRGEGKIDFLTTTLYSDDFIYYPDSVTSLGTGGAIRPGAYNGASYPEAIFADFDMHWIPRKDSMYIRNVGAPFKFYQSTAELDGEMNITTKGVFGEGTMRTRGSVSRSTDFTFSEYAYRARHAHFEIETDNPDKPAMEGDDIELDFDLASEVAEIKPEQRGVAALSFPYAQMKTSITQAVWDLPNGLITMTRPEEVLLEDSYFYSTRPELDSLAFSGTRAVYDLESYDLTIEGIPFIVVADSKIIPEGNATTIRENSQLEPFSNATIIIDTLNGYHTLTNGNIKINSRNSFEGSAFYLVAFGSDTFQIRFDSFELREVPISPKEWRLMTVSGGEVPEAQNLKIAPGFYYKGTVEMFAFKEALELDGFVRMDVQNLRNENLWIPYQRRNKQVRPHIPIENAILESGQRAIAGVHIDQDGQLYSTFVEPRNEGGDKDFFRAYGNLSFDEATQTYLIETQSKSEGAYEGYSMFYSDVTSDILFEGPAQFMDPGNSEVEVKASVTGYGNKRNENYTLDGFFAIDIDVPTTLIDEFAVGALDAIERLGAPPANELKEELMYKVSNIIGQQSTKKYKERALEDYVSLVSASRELAKTLVISKVKMEWDNGLQTWHNTSKIGVSNLGKNDINGEVNGFMEFAKDEVGADKLNVFLEFAPDTWLFIGYSKNNLVMYSSLDKVNAIIESKSNLGKEKPGELLFVLGDQSETLSFINDFRSRYYGIREPYKLVFPSETSFGDDFGTEEEDSDGF